MLRDIPKSLDLLSLLRWNYGTCTYICVYFEFTDNCPDSVDPTTPKPTEPPCEDIWTAKKCKKQIKKCKKKAIKAKCLKTCDACPVCEDKWDAKKCKKEKKKDKCDTKNVKKNCQKTCEFC